MARNVLSSFPIHSVLTILLVLLPLRPVTAGHDYHDALRKSILFFEGQRSGRLPPDQRLQWRRDSALHDGATAGVSKTPFHFTQPHFVYFSLFYAHPNNVVFSTCIVFHSGGLNRGLL